MGAYPGRRLSKQARKKRDEEIIRLNQKGYKPKEIAPQFGLIPATIRLIIKEHNVRKNQ